MRIRESAIAKEMVLEADGLEQESDQRQQVCIEHRTFFNHKTAIEEMLGIEIMDGSPFLWYSSGINVSNDFLELALKCWMVSIGIPAADRNSKKEFF